MLVADASHSAGNVDAWALTIAQLYVQIGYESQRALRWHAVETTAARDTAREVMKELKARERLSSTN